MATIAFDPQQLAIDSIAGEAALAQPVRRQAHGVQRRLAGDRIDGKLFGIKCDGGHCPSLMIKSTWQKRRERKEEVAGTRNRTPVRGHRRLPMPTRSSLGQLSP